MIYIKCHKCNRITGHKLVGLVLMCIDCEVVEQMKKDNERVWNKIIHGRNYGCD